MAKSKHGGARQGAGRKSKNKQKVLVSMSAEAKEAMKTLGQGNLSEGVEIGARIFAEMTADKFFARSPVSEQSRLLFEVLLEQPDLIKSDEFRQRITDVVEKIESLGIETAYEDAVIEGVIEPKGGCYIV